MDTQRIHALETRLREAHSQLEGAVISEENISRDTLKTFFAIRQDYLNARREYYQKNGKPYKPAA